MIRNILSLVVLLLIGPILALAMFYPDFVFVLVFLGALIIAPYNIWVFLPRRIRELFKRRSRFVWITFLCVSVFVFSSAIINYYFLPDIHRPASIISILVILLFVCLLGWCFTAGRGYRFVTVVLAIVVIHLLAIRYIDVQLSQEPPISSIDDAKSSPAQDLKSLPYISWIPDKEYIDKLGVTKYVPELAHDGWNLFACDYSPNAYLIDMSGGVVHKWFSERDYWQHVEMCGVANLLGIVQDERLVKLNWDGRTLWKKRMRFHHDLDLDKDGTIYALTKRCDIYWSHGFPIPVLNDYITVLSPEGFVIKNISLLDILSEVIPPEKLKLSAILPDLKEFFRGNIFKMFSQKLILTNNFGGYDLLHTNTIEIIHRDIKGLCNKGDLLICVRNLDWVGVVDVVDKKVKWSWGSNILDKPHQPSLLVNGNILIFDNGMSRKYSRILEIDPLTGEIVWEYKADPPEDFYSSGRGGVQRLPNGNTLITDSNKGRVFEITPDREVVWEFYSPEIKKEDQLRKPIYRLMRVRKKFVSGYRGVG